jgi:hypothetical protein
MGKHIAGKTEKNRNWHKNGNGKWNGDKQEEKVRIVEEMSAGGSILEERRVTGEQMVYFSYTSGSDPVSQAVLDSIKAEIDRNKGQKGHRHPGKYGRH